MQFDWLAIDSFKTGEATGYKIHFIEENTNSVASHERVTLNTLCAVRQGSSDFRRVQCSRCRKVQPFIIIKLEYDLTLLEMILPSIRE